MEIHNGYYFIKNEQGSYVGIVYDMVDDLHYLVKEHERHKGHMSTALRDVIFPDLYYSKGRRLQRASFQNETGRHHLLDVMGFELISEHNYDHDKDQAGTAQLSLEPYSRVLAIKHCSNLSSEDFLSIKGIIAHAFKRIDRIRQYLRHINAPESCPELDHVHLHLSSLLNAVEGLLQSRFDASKDPVPVWLSDKQPDWSGSGTNHDVSSRLNHIHNSLASCLYAIYYAVANSSDAEKLGQYIKTCVAVACDSKVCFPLEFTYTDCLLYNRISCLLSQREL